MDWSVLLSLFYAYTQPNFPKTLFAYFDICVPKIVKQFSSSDADICLLRVWRDFSLIFHKCFFFKPIFENVIFYDPPKSLVSWFLKFTFYLMSFFLRCSFIWALLERKHIDNGLPRRILIAMTTIIMIIKGE